MKRLFKIETTKRKEKEGIRNIDENKYHFPMKQWKIVVF